MKISITIQELKSLYNKHSNKYVCEKLRISQPTLLLMLRKVNIKLKGMGNRTKRSKINIIR